MKEANRQHTLMSDIAVAPRATRESIPDAIAQTFTAFVAAMPDATPEHADVIARINAAAHILLYPTGIYPV